VWRGLNVLVLVAALALVTPASAATAASEVELTHAADGTLVVLGSGWRPSRQLVVSLGQEHFTADVDETGDFEIPTGLAGLNGDLAVHHAALASATIGEAPVSPSPLAVLFARSLVEGALVLVALFGVVVLGAYGIRAVREVGYPRRKHR
jgi:hypothetical protein